MLGDISEEEISQKKGGKESLRKKNLGKLQSRRD